MSHLVYRDCDGVCFGTAVIDECGYCTGEGTGLMYNELLDCTGVCGGPFRADSCDACQRPDDRGHIVEHRDCNDVCFGTALLDSCGLCYGGDTNDTADLGLDACNVCFGDNSTCIGCDGIVNSGFTVDTCGECGHNDCGCFKINSISPNRGPSTGGTQIIVKGAGFFLDDDSLTQYDPQAPNCGAPTSFSNGDIILPRCYFRSATQQFSTIGLLVDHTTILCTTTDTTGAERSSIYDLHIGIHDGPLTPATPNAVFHNDEYSNVLITEMTPTWNIIGNRTLLSYVGHNFSDTGFVSCIIYGLQNCLLDSADTMTVYSATSVSSTRVDCDLPPVDTPCQTTIRLSSDGQSSGQAIPFAANLDFMFTFYAAAPVVTRAYFTDDMTSVFLHFDKRIELIQTTLSCSNVFSATTVNMLGTNPACIWSSSSFDQMAILLPADAQLTHFTPIEFNDDNIRAYGQLYSRNITNYSVQAGGGTKPVAIIEGLDSIPSCGTVTFTGRQSLYSGYGGFRYMWSVSVLDSTTSGFREIQNYLNGLTPENDNIALNTDHFVSNLEYYLQLTVTNSIGLVSDTRRRLIKQGSPVPQIQLVGDKMNRLECGSSIVLQVEVDSLSCSSLSGDLTYQWGVFEVEKSKRMTPVLQDTSSLRTDSPTLYIPSSLFQCNYTYIAVITATIGSASNSNNFTIDVLPVALRAHIYGGNRTVARHRSLILDATRSIIIPDAGPVSYTWSCKNADTSGPCHDSTIGNTSVIGFDDTDYINIPANLFALNTLYLIQLTMKQGDSISSEAVQIQFTDLTPPTVEIVVPVSEVFVVTDRIIIEGLVFSIQPTRRVFWQCAELPGQACVDLNDNSIAELQITYDSLSASTIDSTTDLSLQYIEPDQVNRVKLVIKPNVLTAGFQYTFRLMADNRMGEGYSEITITPLPPPTLGSIDIQPLTGTCLNTLFTITCTAASTTEHAQPIEYQYGIITRTASGMDDLSEGDIQWLTGKLRTEQLTTLLPGNNQDDNIDIVVRVSDRYGAYTDLFGIANVQLAATTNYMTVLSNIMGREQRNKTWTIALSSMTALLVQINETSNSPFRGVKRNVLSAALDIYDSSLVPTKDHLIQFVSLLSYITGDPEVVINEIDRTSAAMNAIITELVSYEAAVSEGTNTQLSSDGEPLILASGSSPVVQNYMALTAYEGNLIFNVWSDLISVESSAGTQFRNAVDKISLNLCQSKLQGENHTTLQSSESQLQIIKTLPSGVVSLAGGTVLTVDSIIVNYYFNNLCTRTAGCEEVCTMIATTKDDVLAIESATNPNNMVLKLSTRSVNMISNNIMYVDPMELQPYSPILSFSLLAPARSEVLEISDLSASHSVQLPLKSNSAPDGTQFLCLYRQPANGSWQLDSITPPETLEIDGILYAVCRYNHLTDFIIALLPAPITPSPTPTPTPSSTSTTMTPTSTSTTSSIPVTTTSLPQAASGGGGGGAGGAIAAVVVILFVLGIAVAVIIVVIIWRKKRQKRKVGIAKDPPQGLELQESLELTKAALLTPEEAKIPMQIITIAEGGQKQRELLGTLNVLPQIRLRELRNQLFDNFESLKNKPFYFLTKQLCDIEPAAEQMQFVNLVYDKTVFIREAEGNTERSRRHFCTCGLAAQFECSQCTAQGYCSPECQYKHWTEEHSKECRRLAERKRRTTILSRRQTPTSPIGELPPVQPGSLVQQGQRFLLASIDAPDAPASPPTDFRSLLMAQKAASRISLASNRTSLGNIASRSPNTLSRTSGIGVTQQHPMFSTPKPSLPGQPVAIFDRSSTTKVVIPEHLLSSKPATAASMPATTAATPQQQGMMRGPSDSSMLTPQSTQHTPMQPRMASMTSAGSLSQSQPTAMLRHQPTAVSMTSEQLDQSFTSQKLPPTPQTADGPQAFVRKKFPHQVTPRVMSRMTIQSVVSQDLDVSGRNNIVRDEPLLESDEDEYEETSSSSGSEASDDDHASSSRPVSRKPPSLARRSVATISRTERKASSTESSSGSEESDSETETDSEDDDDQSKLVQEKSQKSATPSKTITEHKTTTTSTTVVQSTKSTENDSEEDELKDDKKLIKDQDDKVGTTKHTHTHTYTRTHIRTIAINNVVFFIFIGTDI